MKKLFMIIITIFTALLISLNFVTVNKLGLSLFQMLRQRLPVTDTIDTNHPESMVLSRKSYFEKQGKSQCGGFSSAYVLRYLGEDISGLESYNAMKLKFKNGYVLPQAITNLFRENGYGAKLYRGNLNTLKTRVNMGQPVIALIGDAEKWQHYVTITGFDKNNIYLYDSNYHTNNSSGYNRAMTYDEFSNVWNNGIPVFSNIYFSVEE